MHPDLPALSPQKAGRKDAIMELLAFFPDRANGTVHTVKAPVCAIGRIGFAYLLAYLARVAAAYAHAHSHTHTHTFLVRNKGQTCKH